MAQGTLDLGPHSVREDADASPGAAAAVRGLGGAAARVYLAIRDAARGLTCDEAERGLPDLPHQTVSARIRELETAGLLARTAERRGTRKGRTAAVYLVPEPLLPHVPDGRGDPVLIALPEPVRGARDALVAEAAAVLADGIRRGDAAAAISARILDLADARRA